VRVEKVGRVQQRPPGKDRKGQQYPELRVYF